MRKQKLLIAAVAILLALGLAHYFVRKNYCLPILMYHSINPAATSNAMLSIAPKTFERQMRFLKNFGYNVVPLESVIAFLEEGRPIPARTVAITIDDGYRDNYTYAFPILKEYNFPATIFIITGEVGRTAGDRLSWDEIKQMRDSGLVSFGSHTLGPEPLVNIKSDDEIRRQIFLSKKTLEERLGERVKMFSYPEGRFNNSIKQMVKEAGYNLAVATSPGKGFPNNDILALKRLRISSNSGNLFVFWVETSGIYNFIKERHNRKKH